MLQDRNREDAGLTMPPLGGVVHIEDGYFIVLKKGDRSIVRVNTEDTTGIMAVVAVLNGVLSAGLTRDELETVRDILQGVVGS